MNRILFEKPELLDDGTVRLSDNRAKQIREVLRAEVGAVLKVGMIDGLAGRGEIVESAGESVRLSVTLDTEAPAPWFDLLLAVPRPKVLKRLWAQLAALGAGRIVLLNAARVERVYFDSHWLREEHVRPLLIEGLTQCGATQLPEVSIQRRFRPFVEDDLDAAFPTLWRLAAHPGPVLPVPAPPAHDRTARPLLAIGPEGGLDALRAGDAGCAWVSAVFHRGTRSPERHRLPGADFDSWVFYGTGISGIVAREWPLKGVRFSRRPGSQAHAEHPAVRTFFGGRNRVCHHPPPDAAASAD